MRFLLDTDHISLLQIKWGSEYGADIGEHCGSPGPGCLALNRQFSRADCRRHNYLKNAKKPAELLKGYRLLDDILFTFTQLTVLPFDARA